MRRLGGWQRASAILIWVTVVADALTTVTDRTGRAGPWWTTVSVSFFVVHLVTAAVFIRWLWLARADAEVLNPARHRHDRMWVVVGWFVPILAFWRPQAVVRDVWNATNPARPRGTGHLVPTPGVNLVGWWWAAFVTEKLLGLAARTPIERAADFAALAANVVAAVLITVISGRITGFVREEATFSARSTGS